MEKLRTWCLVVLFCIPNMAFAHEGIRVFDSYASPGEYNERVEVWSGCPVVGDSIDTDCLANTAYDFALSTGALALIPPSNQDRESYKDLFLRWNDLGSTMSTARFMRKASGTGFYLPQGRGRTIPLSTMEWSTIRGEVDLLQQQMRTLEPESAESMRARITALENRLGVDFTTAGLLGTLSTLEAMIKNFPTLSQAELDAQKAELEERLSGFDNRITRVEETKVDKTELTSLEARVSSLENSSLSASFTSAETTGFLAKVNEWLVQYWWIPALLLLIGVLWRFLSQRKKPQVIEEVTAVVTPVGVVPSIVRTTTDGDSYETLRLQVHDPKIGVLARLGRLEEVVDNNENGVLARMDQLDTAVTQLRTDYDYLLLVSTDGLRMVGTPDQETLEALAIGEHIDLKIEGDEGDRTVRIVRGTFENENSVIEDRLYVYGVSDVNQGVSVDSVRLSRCLLRAIKEWKVVGIDDPKVGLSAAAFVRTPRKLTFRRSAKKAA